MNPQVRASACCSLSALSSKIRAPSCMCLTWIICTQGFVKQEPMPEFFWKFGRIIADAWFLVTGCRINDFEGYMIVVSTLLMLVTLVGWIIIDLGNERDRARDAEESNDSRPIPMPQQPRPAPAPKSEVNHARKEETTSARGKSVGASEPDWDNGRHERRLTGEYERLAAGGEEGGNGGHAEYRKVGAAPSGGGQGGGEKPSQYRKAAPRRPAGQAAAPGNKYAARDDE